MSLKKTRVELNNAVFSLPDYVARDEGYFEAHGLDVELVQPARRREAMAATAAPVADPAQVRSFLWHAGFEEGEFSVYHACEWGQMRRSQDSCVGAKVITKRAAVSSQAIIGRPDAPYHTPQDLTHVPVAVNFHAGSHYITVGLLSGFMPREAVEVVHIGVPNQRFEALAQGRVAAATLMEPWITVAEKLGYKLIAESFYVGLEVADPSVDPETYRALDRAHRMAVRQLRADVRPYLKYLIAEVPGDIVTLAPEDFHLNRLRYVDPEPYSPEEFQKTHDWMVSWGLIEPEGYRELVDSRAS